MMWAKVLQIGFGQSMGWTCGWWAEERPCWHALLPEQQSRLKNTASYSSARLH